MTEGDNIPLAPVSEWTLREVRAYNVLILNLGYLTSAMQSTEAAHQSPNFALTQAQALELSKSLAKYAANLPGHESSEASSGPPH